MTLDDSAEMAEGKDPDESKGAAGNEYATVNGHIDDDDHAAGSSDFTASILGHPSTILIVTNVDDATFVSTEVKVTAVACLHLAHAKTYQILDWFTLSLLSCGSYKYLNIFIQIKVQPKVLVKGSYDPSTRSQRRSSQEGVFCRMQNFEYM